MTNKETNQTKRIEAYSIADFVKQIQEAVLDGFRLNLEDNEKYPLQIGVGFYCTMDKPIALNVTIKNEGAYFEKDGVETFQPMGDIVQQPITKLGRKPKV